MRKIIVDLYLLIGSRVDEAAGRKIGTAADVVTEGSCRSCRVAIDILSGDQAATARVQASMESMKACVKHVNISSAMVGGWTYQILGPFDVWTLIYIHMEDLTSSKWL